MDLLEFYESHWSHTRWSRVFSPGSTDGGITPVPLHTYQRCHYPVTQHHFGSSFEL